MHRGVAYSLNANRRLATCRPWLMLTASGSLLVYALLFHRVGFELQVLKECIIANALSEKGSWTFDIETSSKRLCVQPFKCFV
jgi:hypothetical protein